LDPQKNEVINVVVIGMTDQLASLGLVKISTVALVWPIVAFLGSFQAATKNA
jgi:hypothetical protein